MKRQEIPLLEYDGTVPAVLEPSKLIAPIDVPEQCVLTFFQDVIEGYKNAGRLVELRRFGSERGHNPLYEMEINGRRLSVIQPGVGAPLAAAFMDELIALGCRKFIACGGCEVLDGNFKVGHVIVPVAAVRDEGTSYHYLPPDREVRPSLNAIKAITTVLDSQDIEYVMGKTWTTDAFYRETAEKVALRRKEGCLCVEMETAALCAVAKFRGVTFGHLLYGGDDLSGDEWDSRDWQNQTPIREALFSLAAAACLLL
jgi:uridine phosphorylase